MSSWGKYGSDKMPRYMVEVEKTRDRPMCRCGCRRRITHRGFANGVCLESGCELRVRRWVRNPEDTHPRRRSS